MTGPEPVRRSEARTALLTVALVGAIAVLGANVEANTTAVFVVVLLVAVLPLINSRPAIWIALAIALPWTSRLLTVLGGAPRFLDFMDFPLVLIAFVLSGVRYLGGTRRLDPAHQRITRRLAVVALVIALSWAFNDPDQPQRLVAAWVLALEPFLLLAAILLAPLTARDWRRLFLLVTSLLCGQLLFSLVTIFAGRTADDVKGSLLATGAGHHVSAGGLALGFFILARQRVPKVVIAGFGAFALFVIVVADAKQVLFVLPLALLVLAVSGRRSRSAVSLIVSVVGGVLMAGGAVFAIVSYQGSATALTYIDDAGTNDTGKVAVAAALWSDLTASPAGLAVGLGPGQSVSRFAFLTTPALFKEGSPVALLGLQVSRGADHYNAIAFSGVYNGGDSSFSSAQSSILGVVGDYGVLGVLAFGALILAVLGALRRSRDRRLRASALAAWVLLLPLAAVFDWLEQPPFTLAVVLITGLALRSGVTHDDPVPTRETSGQQVNQLVPLE